MRNEGFPYLVSSRNVRHRHEGKTAPHRPVASHHDLVATCGARVCGSMTGVGNCGLWTASEVPQSAKACPRCENRAKRSRKAPTKRAWKVVFTRNGREEEAYRTRNEARVAAETLLTEADDILILSPGGTFYGIATWVKWPLVVDGVEA